jgi:sulfate adenylyltransferase subunit 1
MENGRRIIENDRNGLLKFIACGSVDDGKSTLIGHILYDAKLLYADQEQALILDSRAGSRGGDIDYSLLLDGLMAEREQGITIDVAYRYFTTSKRGFIVADTPGHEQYTRNMAVGASFADLAVILIDASQGVLKQTRRHARICTLMGIRHFAFAINKMDLVGFERNVYDKIAADVKTLKEILAIEEGAIIPLSAAEGDNLTERSARTPWYNGPTLMEYLENADISTNIEPGFYMPVQRVCRPDHTFRGFQGQIESGVLRVGDEICALPGGEKAFVRRILAGFREENRAVAGKAVTILLDREVDVSRGCVLHKDSGVKVSRMITADILWMDDPPLALHTEYWAKIGTKLIPAAVSAINHKVDVNTGEKTTAATLAKNELGECSIVLAEEIPLSEFSVHKTLGELILIDRVSDMTAACGVVRAALQKREYQRENDPIPVYSGYTYPDDFDIRLKDGVVSVRRGKFAGFDKHGANEDCNYQI